MSKEILRELGMIYRALNTFIDLMLKEMGLEKGQYQFLVRIKENPGINQQELSSNLLVDKTTTAKSVNKLVKKGLVLKKTDVADKRSQKLYITGTAAHICDFLDNEERYVGKITVQGMDSEEQRALLGQLRKITANVEPLFTDAKTDKKDCHLNKIRNGNI